MEQDGQGAVGGSIPACAGEPMACSMAWHSAMVYPRVCGGTGLRVAAGLSLAGLSPRVRGNRFPVHTI